MRSGPRTILKIKQKLFATVGNNNSVDYSQDEMRRIIEGLKTGIFIFIVLGDSSSSFGIGSIPKKTFSYSTRIDCIVKTGASSLNLLHSSNTGSRYNQIS